MSVSKWRSYLPSILSLVILIVFGIYLYRNADRYKQLLEVSTGALFLFLILRAMFLCVSGSTNYLLYRAMHVPIGLHEAIGLAIVNTLSNNLPFMGGGLIAKSVYLKQKYELAYTRFLGATFALFVCSVAINGIVGLTVLGYWVVVQDIIVPVPLALGFFGMAAILLFLWLPFDFSIIPGKWGRRLVQLMQGWQVLSQNRLLLIQLIGLTLLNTLIFAGRYWIAFHMLSQDVTLTQCILFSAATVLTHFMNITPGALGVREAIVAGVAAILGFEVEVSVVAVGIDRLISTLLVVVLGVVYTHILGKQLFKPAGSIPASRVVHEHSHLDQS